MCCNKLNNEYVKLTRSGEMLEQLKDVLKLLKWTEGQASVYCTLVEKGAMKPADLVIHAGVAQGKIYSVLDELSEKGAIIKSRGKPTKYDAQNPRYVLDIMLDILTEKKEDALQRGAEEAYEKRYDQLIRETTCWAVQGISGVLVQMRALVENCESSLMISDPDLNWIGSSGYRMLDKLLRDEKTLQVLGGPVMKDVLGDLNNKGADVRICDGLPSYYLIDGKAALLRFIMPDCGVVIMDDAFVRGKVMQFNSDFERGSESSVNRIEG